jgi:hypothetical protein
MKPEEAGWCSVDFKPRKPNSEADQCKCPACGIWSSLSEWVLEYVDCDTCGTSEAMGCPACGENIGVHDGCHRGVIEVQAT